MTIAFLQRNPLYDYIVEGKDDGGLYNGYVATDKELPLSYQGGADWSDSNALDNFVNVHGGITYDSTYGEFREIIPLTSIPDLEILKNMRVIGFDTLHSSDTQERWPFEAIKAETLRLLKQIEKL